MPFFIYKRLQRDQKKGEKKQCRGKKREGARLEAKV